MVNERHLQFWIVNTVSLLRIPLAAAFLYMYLDPFRAVRLWSFVVLAALLASDFVDGALARRFSVSTKFGYIVDGVTDRAAYIAIILAISWRDEFPLLLGYAVIVRDFLLYGLRSYYPRWMERLPLQRHVAHFHAGAVRILFGYYLGKNAFGSFTGRTVQSPTLQKIDILAAATGTLLVAVSYWSLWLLFREQMALHTASPVDELESASSADQAQQKTRQ